MAETLIVLDGRSFFYSDAAGDVEVEEAEGFFVEDVRHLSRWQLTVDGKPIEVLTSRLVDHFSALVAGTAGEDGEHGPALSVRRERFASGGFHEDLVVRNLTREPRKVRVELAFDSDFADVMEAMEGSRPPGRVRGEVRKGSVVLSYERKGYRRETIVAFGRRGRLSRSNARFDLALAAGTEWRTCVDVTAVVQGKRRRPLLRCESFGRDPKMPVPVKEWLADAPELEADWDCLRHVYRRSLLDLAALRIRPDHRLRHALPAGGLPWFMALFGRDSMLAAYQLLPFNAGLAEATLQELAAYQATEVDHFRDAEPGKILHELRHGTLASTGEIPHSPYYGAHDTTPLFLILLDEYERWTGDAVLVRKLEPEARAALAWIEGAGDLDGDGYLEYRKRSQSDRALDNHCWKDSSGAIVFPDGRRAEPPIAVCEVQGYAYDARLRAARLAREIWRDEELAKRLENEAAALKERFNCDFWSGRRRCYVLALDGEKRPVDVVASNMGHLLWSGIVPKERAARVVRRLLRDDLWSGWGIRTLAATERPYSPLGYHTGAVWPHDTAICAEGMRRYGFAEEAGRVLEGLFAAAEAFSYQLPEVFAGFPRDAANVPVEFPGAMKPQAWAAGAPLLGLRTLLGLDVVRGRLRARPCLPDGVGRIRLRGVDVRGGRTDVR